MQHMAVVHDLQFNRSTLASVGLFRRYINTNVIQSKAADSATLALGVDTRRHFIHGLEPVTDWSDAAISAFEKAPIRHSTLG